MFVMILSMLFAAATAVVDPATYVGNVYGAVVDPSGAPLPNATVLLVDHERAIRTATTDRDGKFLINNVPAPFDGRDYTVVCGDSSVTAHVLPGASMALEVNFTAGDVTWRYRHEQQPLTPGSPTLSPQAGRGLKTLNYTRTIFATREGLVGGTTANGHVIVPNDRFAALPSRRALSTNFGHEREVRVTYRDKITVIPVWDVGPWNTHDDYWNPTIIRETFKDLPRGTPEAEAAVFSGYNGGFDERGRKVITPAGIDLADGTFQIDLAMTANDRVVVEYLWLDQEGPTTIAVNASPASTTFVVDAQISDVATGNSPLQAAEMFVDSIGENGSGFPLNATDGAFDSPVENVRGVIDSLPPGIHVIYVHGRDAYGNWGAVMSSSITVAGNAPRRRSVRHS
jgi:hypothetical protein